MAFFIRAGLIGLMLANISICVRERGRPNYLALVGANIVAAVMGAGLLWVFS